MRVGILTFHRAHNYGAVLQCYALQETLKKMGHDVRIIDYRQPWIEEFYKLYSIDMLKRNSGSVKDIYQYLKKNTKKFMLAPFKNSHFRSFRDDFMNLTQPCFGSLPQEFDAYVIGSDQLWSLHCLGGEADPVYFGDFERPAQSVVIGYAISADKASVDALASRIADSISNFSSLSMREAGIASSVANISGRPCDVCLDPTLLTDSDMWEDVIDDRWSSLDYVLVYEVRWKKENKGLLRRKAEELAASVGNGCKVIDLSSGRYPVTDFVSLFRYAKYVVTTSFHGTVFSILFERPFYVFPLWNGYDLRYLELLENVGASDRVASRDERLLPEPMDFRSVKSGLDRLRKSSSGYLENSLKIGK